MLPGNPRPTSTPCKYLRLLRSPGLLTISPHAPQGPQSRRKAVHCPVSRPFRPSRPHQAQDSQDMSFITTLINTVEQPNPDWLMLQYSKLPGSVLILTDYIAGAYCTIFTEMLQRWEFWQCRRSGEPHHYLPIWVDQSKDQGNIIIGRTLFNLYQHTLHLDKISRSRDPSPGLLA